jgi:predicted SprT family Zn-dependent metalloprotease
MFGGLFDRLLSETAEEPVLSEVRTGGARFERLVFTRNRRVMISTGDRGTTLRLNERFREAPPEVLRAVGRLLSRPSAGSGRAARAVILEYLRKTPSSGGPARGRQRLVRRGDHPAIERLAAEFRRVNEAHFERALPTVPIFLSGRMQRRNGHFSPSPLEIVISRRLCSDAEDGEAEKTLRHEMIHLWQHVTGRKLGHGTDFRRWARQLDVHPRATRHVTWSDPRQ